MGKAAWIVVGIVELAAMAVACGVSFALGGCSHMLETTSGGSCYMACHWAFIACGTASIVGIVAAVLSLASPAAPARRACAVVCCAVVFACAFLLSSAGIGLCANTEMHCHTTALYTDIALGVALVVAIVQFARADSGKAAAPKMKL